MRTKRVVIELLRTLGFAADPLAAWGPDGVVVALVFGKYGPQMELIPDNDVVQACASDGPNDAFCISVLPGTARRDWSVADTTAAQTVFEQLSKFGVVVSDQIPGINRGCKVYH